MQGLDLNVLRLLARIEQERRALAKRREQVWMAQAIEARIALELTPEQLQAFTLNQITRHWHTGSTGKHAVPM